MRGRCIRARLARFLLYVGGGSTGRGLKVMLVRLYGKAMMLCKSVETVHGGNAAS
jgi:hypothetical protein